MIIITQYGKRVAPDGCVHILNKEEHKCPICNGKLIVRDTKRRKVVNQDGSVTIYYLKRLSCKHCGKLHTQFPDCIIPYRHYAAEVIESELIQSQPDCPADNITVRRWKHIFSALFPYILKNPDLAKPNRRWLAELCHFINIFPETTPSLCLS